MTEWRPIPTTPGYEASSDGQIRSPHGTILKPRSLHGGHLRVDITFGSRDDHRAMLVHRLVLMAFVGLPTEDRPICRHLDGNPTNNAIDNLTWGTHSENNYDRVRHGYVEWNRRKTHCKYGHEFTEENTNVRPDGSRNCRTCRVRINAERRAARALGSREAS